MLIIGNGQVITRDAQMPFLRDGSVAMEGTEIRSVGPTNQIRELFPDAQYIDAKGGVDRKSVV